MLPIFLAVFWSGFFVMSIELLGVRVLSPYFGSGLFVWGAMITIFMLALAVGYLLGGHYSQQAPSLQRLSKIILWMAMLSLPTILGSDHWLGRLVEYGLDPRYGALLATACLFAPIMLVAGMVSPYALQLYTTHLHVSGHAAGKLYFVSTLGSALGTWLTSFYWVLWWDLRDIFWGLLMVSCLLALYIRIISPSEVIMHPVSGE